MTLTIDDDGPSLRVTLGGPLRWNDRLGLATIARPLRTSRAGTLVLDASRAHEHDLGCFEGIAQTARRMALLQGREPVVVAPRAAAPAGAGGAAA